MVVPLYTAQFDNVTYFIPLCSDPVQSLWKPDGSIFNLTCEGITLANGELIPTPEEFPSPGCQIVKSDSDSACFEQRYPYRITNGQVTCQEATSHQSRDDGSVAANLTQIANTLAGLTNGASSSAGSAASQGLSAVGCAAQEAFQKVSAYYFNMA